MKTYHKINWLRIKNDYIADHTLTLKSLAQKYKISYISVATHARVGNWRAERKVSETKAIAEVNESNFDAIVDEKDTVNTNHKRLAHNAVVIVNQLLASVIQKMADAQKDGKKPEASAGEVNGILVALERAINLERVTQGLPTSVSKSEVTNTIDMRRVFSDQKIVALAVKLGINAGQLASIGVGAIVDSKD